MPHKVGIKEIKVFGNIPCACHTTRLLCRCLNPLLLFTKVKVNFCFSLIFPKSPNFTTTTKNKINLLNKSSLRFNTVTLKNVFTNTNGYIRF